MERPTPILVGSAAAGWLADMFAGRRRGESALKEGEGPEGRRLLLLRGGHGQSARLYRPLFLILPLVPSLSHYLPSYTHTHN